MRALIVVNAYIRNSSQISQAERIAYELKRSGIETHIKKNINLANITDGRIAFAGGYDFCVYLDKDKSAARMLEESGLRLFNSAQAMELCDNKILTHIALADCGVAMPDCVCAPLCYYPDAQPSEELMNAVKNLGFPVVAKTAYGSLGAGVRLIPDEKSLALFENKNITTEHFYQRFIDCGRGEDVRVIVVGDDVVCAMKRVNDGDFRSNIELGGRGERYIADEELKHLCVKVARILKLDYCGIDILVDRNGKRYVCEVNSNAFFAAAEQVCGVNVAGIYADYMIDHYKKL